MNTKSIKVKTTFQLQLSVPVTVKNVPITAVVSIRVYQKNNSTYELTHEGYEVENYEDTPVPFSQLMWLANLTEF